MSVDTQKNITFLALPNEIQIIIIKYMGVQFINNNFILLKTIYPIYKTIIQDKIRKLSKLYDILFINNDAYLNIWENYNFINGYSKYIVKNMYLSEYLFKQYCKKYNYNKSFQTKTLNYFIEEFHERIISIPKNNPEFKSMEHSLFYSLVATLNE
jgi:hypothetical protein